MMHMNHYFTDDFYHYLQTHNLVEIKGGTDRKTFLEIWMVAIEKRVFARSWNKSPRSWFTAFQQSGVGEIKFGESIISVKGKQLLGDPAMTEKINKRYLEKYNEPKNIYYAEGITQPEYADYTMEFFFES